MSSPSPPPSQAELVSSPSPSAAPVLEADMFTLRCDAGFAVAGLQPGEAAWTPNTVLCTLITMTVISAWIGRRKSIKKLLIFFSHWLSGALYQFLILMQATMISVCWAGGNLLNLIKFLKFLELASANMLAITNLAICVNLALVVMSHRTLSRVSSLSSPPVIWLSLVLSIGGSAAAVPSWNTVILTGTYFSPYSEDERDLVWITISRFFFEFIVGICMIGIVAWLLLFRMKEIKECWKVHARIRYYFGLTLIATGVNLVLGIFGTVYIVGGRQSNPGSSASGLRSIRRLSKRSSKPRVPPCRQVQGRPEDTLNTIRPSQSD
ncbi:unnamed protein product [Ectocarpus fasciculatus]